MGRVATGLVDIVTTPERRQAYRTRGWWDDATLPVRVAHHAATRPDALAVVDEHRRATYRELADDAGALAATLSERGVGPGRVVSIQLPNRYEAAVAAVAVLSTGAVVNPLLPNYRQRELTHVFATADPVAVIVPAEYRGCDHRALVAAVATETGTEPLVVVVDGEPGAGGRRLRCPGRRRSRGDARGPPGRRGVRAHLHLRHRGAAQGHHAHGADGGLQRPRRPPRPRDGRRRRGVDAVSRRSLDRVQLRAALRAAPRAPPRAAGPLGRRHRPAPGAGAPLLVHPGGHDVPPGPHRAGGARGRPARQPAPLRQRRCAGAAEAGGRRRRPGHPGAPPLRIHRGPGGHVEPSRVHPRAEAPHRRRGHVPRRAGRGRRRRHPRRRRRDRGAEGTGTEHLRGLLRRSGTHGGDLRRRRLGALGRPGEGRRRRLSHGGRAQEGDHHPRRHQHHAPGDRGVVGRLPRGRAGRGDRPARRAPGRADLRVRGVAARRGARLRHDGGAPRRGRPRRLQATRAPRGAGRAARHRIGQDPEARAGQDPDRLREATVAEDESGGHRCCSSGCRWAGAIAPPR